MNIFYLHSDPRICAYMHCDKHVVKMILESGQLLSTAMWDSHPELQEILYKPSHLHHPCLKWVKQNQSNFNWLKSLMKELGDEYTQRYGKVHKTMRCVYPHLDGSCLPSGDFTAPPQCVPEQHRGDDVIAAYRSYYHDKLRFIRYTNRGWPDWLSNN